MLIIAVAIAPAIGLILYFYHKDKYEKEPLSLLLKAFMGGMIIAFVEIVIEVVLGLFIGPVSSWFLRIFLAAFVMAALTEEGLKFLVFNKLIYNNKDFNEPYDGILYSVMISLGFAALENINYAVSSFFKAGFSGLMQVGVARAMFAVPAHAFFAVIMGYFLGLSKFAQTQPEKERLISRALWLAVLAHGLYDFFIFTDMGLGLVLMMILFIYCWKFSLKAIRVHVDNSPFKNNTR